MGTTDQPSSADRNRRRRYEHDAVLMDDRGARRGEDADDARRHERDRRRAALGLRGVGAAAHVQAVMIGTTHFTNAVVEARRLAPTGVRPARVCPRRRRCRRWSTGPTGLRDAIGDNWFTLPTAATSSTVARSRRSIRDEIRRDRRRRRRARHPLRRGLVGLLARQRGCEQRAAAILREEIPGATSALSHEIGRIGLLERENAAIMNACLRELARAHRRRLPTRRSPSSGSRRRFYLSQNDGTLMAVDYAERYPVLDVRLRPDELDARRGVPLRRRATARSSTSAARPPTSACSRTAFRARRRSRSRSAACARISACPTSSRSASAAAASSRRPAG